MIKIGGCYVEKVWVFSCLFRKLFKFMNCVSFNSRMLRIWLILTGFNQTTQTCGKHSIKLSNMLLYILQKMWQCFIFIIHGKLL